MLHMRFDSGEARPQGRMIMNDNGCGEMKFKAGEKPAHHVNLGTQQCLNNFATKRALRDVPFMSSRTEIAIFHVYNFVNKYFHNTTNIDRKICVSAGI